MTSLKTNTMSSYCLFTLVIRLFTINITINSFKAHTKNPFYYTFLSKRFAASITCSIFRKRMYF